MNHTPECIAAEEKVNMSRIEWMLQWPQHCRECEGHGGFTFVERHGFNHGPGEVMSDVCETCVVNSICARCGLKTLNEDGDGPCTNCGWNYNDGCQIAFECWGCSNPDPSSKPAAIWDGKSAGGGTFERGE